MTGAKGKRDFAKALRQEVVGRQLRAWRAAAGKSQWQLAEHLGLSTPQFVSNWERGVSLPPLEVLPKFCSFLEVRPEAMLEVLMTYEQRSTEAQLQRLKDLFKGNVS